MCADTRDEAPQLESLAPVQASSLSSIPQPSNSREGLRSTTPDISLPPRVADSADSSSLDVRARLAHLTSTSTQQNNAYDSDSEHARKLKVLQACELVEDMGHEAVQHWGKCFELMNQEYLLPDLEDLNRLKKKTNTELIQIQFEHLVTFSAGLKTGFEQFQALRRPIDDLASANHTTVAEQVEAVIKLRQEVQKSWSAFRQNVDVILSGDMDIWKFKEGPVKETQRRIKSRLATERDKQESTPSPLDTLLRLSKKYRHRWLESKMKQDVYQDEKSKTDALSEKLDECGNRLRDAYYGSLKLDVPIYSSMVIVFKEFVAQNGNNVSFMAVTDTLDEAEGKLLTLIELIDRFLGQIGREYGLKSGTRQVKTLCSRLPHIFIALEMLLSAKGVVVDDHKDIYEEHIYELCKAILEHLNVMQEVHSKCKIVVDRERQAAFLGTDMPRFQNSVAPHLQGIKDVAEAHISTSKSKEAYEERAKQDRSEGNSSWARKERPLVTNEEISWALDMVIDAIVLIGAVSSASIVSDRHEEENSNCSEGTAVDSPLPRIRMSDDMIDQFHGALISEAKKLKTLKDKLERQANTRESKEDEHGGPVKRFLRSLTGKLH